MSKNPNMRLRALGRAARCIRLTSGKAIRIVPLLGRVKVEPFEPTLLSFTHRRRNVFQDWRFTRSLQVAEQSRQQAGNPAVGALNVHFFAGVIELPGNKLAEPDMPVGSRCQHSIANHGHSLRGVADKGQVARVAIVDLRRRNASQG